MLYKQAAEMLVYNYVESQARVYNSIRHREFGNELDEFCQQTLEHVCNICEWAGYNFTSYKIEKYVSPYNNSHLTSDEILKNIKEMFKRYKELK